MPPDQSRFLKIRNHREVGAVLADFANGADLVWYNEAASAVCARWFRLGQQHLRAARQLAADARNWRGAQSRCYYAVYNASKSIRYFVNGSVRLDHRDHKAAGDFPADFPNRARWFSFVTDLRRDRNIADYDPWIGVRNSLKYEPLQAVRETEKFLETCRRYLATRGVKL